MIIFFEATDQISVTMLGDILVKHFGPTTKAVANLLHLILLTRDKSMRSSDKS